MNASCDIQGVNLLCLGVVKSENVNIIGREYFIACLDLLIFPRNQFWHSETIHISFCLELIWIWESIVEETKAIYDV